MLVPADCDGYEPSIFFIVTLPTSELHKKIQEGNQAYDALVTNFVRRGRLSSASIVSAYHPAS